MPCSPFQSSVFFFSFSSSFRLCRRRTNEFHYYLCWIHIIWCWYECDSRIFVKKEKTSEKKVNFVLFEETTYVFVCIENSSSSTDAHGSDILLRLNWKCNARLSTVIVFYRWFSHLLWCSLPSVISENEKNGNKSNIPFYLPWHEFCESSKQW